MLFLPREDGQGLVEYALVLVLVSIVVIAILALLGPQIGVVFSTIRNTLQGTGYLPAYTKQNRRPHLRMGPFFSLLSANYLPEFK